MPSVTILCGPARCGKTERLLTAYRRTLEAEPLGSGLWLSPTWRAAAEVRQRLIDAGLAGCFRPNVMTFGKYDEAVLHAARKPLRPMTKLMKRELVRQILAEQSKNGRLGYFHSIAQTAGLVDLVCEFISDLKRLEIWPPTFRDACAKRGLADKDVEIAEVYECYQQKLREHELFDREGREWAARDILKDWAAAGGFSNDAAAKSQTSILNPSIVVVDGFTDFTRTQHEMLQCLADGANATLVALPLEPSPRRNDLFAKPLKTLAELQRRHPNAVVEDLSRIAPPSWPAIAHLERSLFENPRARTKLSFVAAPASCESNAASNAKPQATSHSSSSNPQSLIPNPLSPFSPIQSPDIAKSVDKEFGIEILAAAKQIGEIEMIGSRIKRLLVDGVCRPNDIAVVFRSTREPGELVREVFGRLGIPTAFESGPTLDRMPVVRALIALLQLDLEDWPFDRLLAVLNSNYFQPDWPERRGASAADVERTVRRLQIPRGREALLNQCGEENQAAAEFWERLKKAFENLPKQATLSDWATAWERLAGETGLLRAMRASASLDLSETEASAADASDDHRAWGRLMEWLGEGEQLTRWLDQRQPEMTRREAFDALLDIAGSDSLGSAGDESGCVRVLAAESVRSLRIPYLFLAGLSEKAFPPPDREDRLYSEADCARLIEAGLPLVARSERTHEEMLLFYEAATRAARHLTLSYPALDESGQPLLPSPFLTEVEEAFGVGVIPRTERADLSPVPAGDEPLCEAEFRLKAVDMALGGDVSLLAAWRRRQEKIANCEMKIANCKLKQASRCSSTPTPSPSPTSTSTPLFLCLASIASRQSRETFGPAEGMLSGVSALARLAEQFDCRRPFSATELESYAGCPFGFFLERILKIEPLDDLTLEFDFCDRGRRVHDLLAGFHEAVLKRLGEGVSPLELEPAAFNALLTETIAVAFQESPTNPVQAALHEVERRQVVEWLSHYREQFETYENECRNFDTPMWPAKFEIPFGDDEARGKKKSGKKSFPPLEFVVGDETFRIAGRIDRIDAGKIAGESVFNVLDYKTGGTLKLDVSSVAAGLTLQLPIYALAVLELILGDEADYLPWRAGYWYVRDAGFKPRQALAMYAFKDGRIALQPDWEEIRDHLGETIAGLVHGILRGEFPVCSADDDCTGRCPFSTVCRINHVRSLEKTWRPTAK